MGAMREVWAFVRGTRARPPPGPSAPLAATLLFAASLAHLPVVYALVATHAFPPAIGLLVGALSMGTAWAGGVALEGRRPGTTRTFCVLAIAQAALAFAPQAAALGPARWLLLVVALLAAAALVALPARLVRA